MTDIPSLKKRGILNYRKRCVQYDPIKNSHWSYLNATGMCTPNVRIGGQPILAALVKGEFDVVRLRAGHVQKSRGHRNPLLTARLLDIRVLP